MPVRRFRSFEEADQALWRRPFDPENTRILASLTSTLRRLGGWKLPTGVFKYRSIEEANRAWDAELHRRVAEIRERMRPLRGRDGGG